MSTADLAAQLREQAARLDVLAEAERVAADAKAAYQADQNPDTKAAHRAAQDALRAARSAARTERVQVSGDGISVAIMPHTIGTSTTGAGV